MGGAGGLAGDPPRTVMPCRRPPPSATARLAWRAPRSRSRPPRRWAAPEASPATHSAPPGRATGRRRRSRPPAALQHLRRSPQRGRPGARRPRSLPPRRRAPQRGRRGARHGLDPGHRGDGRRRRPRRRPTAHRHAVPPAAAERHGAAGVARATVSIPATAAMGGAGGLAGDPQRAARPRHRAPPAKSATSSTTAPSAIAAAWSTWCAAASIPATAPASATARPAWRAPRPRSRPPRRWAAPEASPATHRAPSCRAAGRRRAPRRGRPGARRPRSLPPRRRAPRRGWRGARHGLDPGHRGDGRRRRPRRRPTAHRHAMLPAAAGEVGHQQHYSTFGDRRSVVNLVRGGLDPGHRGDGRRRRPRGRPTARRQAALAGAAAVNLCRARFGASCPRSPRCGRPGARRGLRASRRNDPRQIGKLKPFADSAATIKPMPSRCQRCTAR